MQVLNEILDKIGHSIMVEDGVVKVKDEGELKKHIPQLAEMAALADEPVKSVVHFLIRGAALDLGIVPSSIHSLYMARGRGEIAPDAFTVPAMNLRVLPFLAARAVFRNAIAIDAGALILEIARSEIGYTDQRPAEYVAEVLAAAIIEGFRGPVFIQGDHFQISPKRYKENAEAEVQAVRDLAAEAIAAGFYNIDVDTSTLVDLSKPTVPEQQALNFTLSAELTAYIRSIQPEGITVSVGGEIGEVGGHNSTPEELRAYMDGYNRHLEQIAPSAAGLSKISIQTGTSHGGVVLPDGSIAKVKVDFNTLKTLSRIAREEYGLAGAVQHGASTLPEDMFGKFPEAEACEIHLATNFMNIAYNHMPADLKERIYAYLREHHAHERKPGWTDEQFYYKTRKRALGPFKKEIWGMPEETKEAIFADWQAQFKRLFRQLKLEGTREVVERTVEPVVVLPHLADYLASEGGVGDAEDLSD